MNQQGAPRGHEDDWWRRLYGDEDDDGGGRGGRGLGRARDTGPSEAPDSLEDRVNSALRTVGSSQTAARRPAERGARADQPAPAEPHDLGDLGDLGDPLDPVDPVDPAGPEDGRGPDGPGDLEGLGDPADLADLEDPGGLVDPPDPDGRADAAGPGPASERSTERHPASRASAAPASTEGKSWEPTPWEPTPWEPPRRSSTPRPSRPSAPIPLQSTGPGSRGSAPTPTAPTPPAPAAADSSDAPEDTPPDTPSSGPAAGNAAPPEPEPSGRPASGPAARIPAPPEPEPSKRPASAAAARNGTSSQPPPSPLTADHRPTRDRHPAYDPEPLTLPTADPAALDELVPDTALDGARYGALTLRAVSQRGEDGRYRGDPRRDALLTARFGTGRHALILVAMASGRPDIEGSHRAARDACAWIGGAVGRSYTRLSDDIRTDHRGALKSGLQRLTDRSYGKLRGRAAELGAEPEEYTAALRCLLLPADPECGTRVFFGVGGGGLLRLRDGAWQDLEPAATDTDVYDAPPGHGTGQHGNAWGGSYASDAAARPAPFLFRACTARPGDALLLCSAGMAEPLAAQPSWAARLAAAWRDGRPPGPAAFLGDMQYPAEGHTKDRTAVGVWEIP
ncbi:protein phosphatase 2C domain-containing protein [Streptomyces sp. Pv4-95]|uniref:protein phosphatase 2C domain-containing protein n=1 Tax=Streptomyces sp. Pv4-95 TaxID=3049543 RepID=UPI003892855C